RVRERLTFIPANVIEQVSNTSNGRWWTGKHGFESFIQFLDGHEECCICLDPFRRVGAVVRPFLKYLPMVLGLRGHFSQHAEPIVCGQPATSSGPMPLHRSEDRIRLATRSGRWPAVRRLAHGWFAASLAISEIWDVIG